MISLPFNLEKISDRNYLITNYAGFYSFISDCELNNLISFGSVTIDKKSELESKLFVSSEDGFSIASALLTSALTKKTKAAMSFNPIYMIVPTLRCDHTCKYCQVSRASAKANGYDLEGESISDYFNLIKKLSNPPYKIEIQGGEPLIRYDLVKEIYVQALAKLGDGNFQIVITSSLSLIDDDIIEWCLNKNIAFSVSLDGDQLVHDSNRILPGESSYVKVVQGIKKIKSILGAESISTVTTVTKRLIDNPESLLIAHEEIGVYDLFVRPVSQYGFADSVFEDTYDFESYMEFYRKLILIMASEKYISYPFVEHSAAIHMKRIHSPSFNSYADLKSPSGVVYNALILNYDGKVYGSDETRMLQRKISQDISCGDPKNFSSSDKIYYNEVLASSFNIVKPGCDHCVYLPYCGSDPCQNISEFGDPIGDTPSSSFCRYHKSMFNFIFRNIESNGKVKEILERWIDA